MQLSDDDCCASNGMKPNYSSPHCELDAQIRLQTGMRATIRSQRRPPCPWRGLVVTETAGVSQYHFVSPPSMTNSAPVENELSSESR